MRPPGSFKIARRHRLGRNPTRPAPETDPLPLLSLPTADRAQRVVDSIRSEVLEGGETVRLRLRCVFRSPREIYRLELELPERDYQRTTLLDRDTVEELLEIDEIRAIIGTRVLSE
jgi:hypothetical protein